jgi:hypothetical protein
MHIEPAPLLFRAGVCDPGLLRSSIFPRDFAHSHFAAPQRSGLTEFGSEQIDDRTRSPQGCC